MKKRKNIFKLMLAAILCLLPGFLLAGCTEGIPVTSINFRESVIEMLVGDDYVPQVFVSPNGADNKSYTLRSNDAQVVSVNGNKLIAQSIGEAIVTATSNSGFKNASVRVVVHAQSINLEIPEDLVYNGERITFTASENAYNYAILLNGEEIELGNNTYYASAPAGRVNTVKVMAVGNGRVSISSAWSEEYKFYQFATPTNLKVDDGILSFDEVVGVTKYELTLSRDGTADQTIYLTGSGQNVSSYMTVAGDYRLTLKALKIDYDSSVVGDLSGVEKFDSKMSSTIVVSKSAAPTGLHIAGNRVLFNQESNTSQYELGIYTTSINDVQIYPLTENYMELDSLAAGQYNFVVRGKKGVANSLVSDWSNPLVATKLKTPTVAVEDGVIKVDAIDGATGYNLIINGQLVNIGPATTYSLGKAYTAGSYTIGAQCYANDDAIISSNITPNASRLIAEKLVAPSDVAINQGVLTFSGNNTDATYGIYIDGELLTNITALSHTFANTDFAQAKTYQVTIGATKEGCLSAELSESLPIIRLKAPNKVNLAGDQFEIDAVESTEGYKIEFINLTDSTKTILEEVPAKTWMNVPEMENGEYQVIASAIGNGKNILGSEGWVLEGVSVLPTPNWQPYANNVLSFDEVPDVNMYNITIGSREIDSTSTTITLDDLVFWKDIPAGEYVVKVRAIGDNAKVLSSKFTTDANTLKIVKLGIPTGLVYDEDTKTLSWTAVSNATSYDVYKGNTLLSNVLTNSITLEEFTTAGNFTYKVKAVGGNYIAQTKTGYANSEFSTLYTIHKSAMATKFSLDGNNLVWKKVAGMSYTINIDGGDSIDFTPTASNEINVAGETLYCYNLVTGLWTANENFESAGEYKISLVAYNDNSASEYVLPSQATESLTISKLENVTNVSMTDRKLTWQINQMAAGYYIIIDGSRYVVSPINNNAVNGQNLTIDINDYVDAGEHTVSIVAKGDGYRYFDSVQSATVDVEKLESAQLSYSGSKLSWASVDKADYYKINIRYSSGGEFSVERTTSELSYDINADEDLAQIPGIIKFNVVAYSREHAIINSEDSATLTINRFDAPQMMVIYGEVGWGAVANASEYEIMLDGESLGEYSGVSRLSFSGKPAGTHTVQIVAKNKAQNSGVAGDTIYADGVIGTLDVTKLNAPTGFGVQNGKYKFAAVDNAEYYYIYVGNGYYLMQSTENASFYQDLVLYYNSAEYGSVDPQAYVVASADGYITSEPSDKIKVRMLEQPKNMRIVDNVISWKAVTDASGYNVSITNVLEGVIINQQVYDISTNSLNLPSGLGWLEGDYYITVQAYGGQIADTNGTVYLTLSRPSSQLLVIKQQTITGLKSFGGEIGWNGIATATKYNLVITDAEGNETNATTVGKETTFNMVSAGFAPGYYKLRVQAVGNGEEIVDSPYCEDYEFILMPSVAEGDVKVSRGNVTFKAPSIFSYAKLTFTNKQNASIKYEFDYSPDKFSTSADLTINPDNRVRTFADAVLRFGSDYASWDYEAVFEYMSMTYTYNLPIMIPDGEYNLTIKLVGNSYDGQPEITIGNISLLSSAVSSLKEVEKLQVPEIEVNGGVISWYNVKEYTGMKTYRVIINNTYAFETDKFTSIDFNQDGLDIDQDGDIDFAFEDKLYQVCVILVGDDTIYLSSNSSDTEDVRILSEPVISQSIGKIKWESITHATGYKLELVDYPTAYTGNTNIRLASNITSYSFISDSFPAGDYKIKIYALGNNEDILMSKSKTVYEKTKVDISQTNFHLDKGILHWTAVEGLTRYAITVNGHELTVDIADVEFTGTIDSATQKVSYELPSAIGGYVINDGSYIQVTMYVVGDDINLLSSSRSDMIENNKAPNIEEISLVDGALSWSNELASQYSGFDVLLGFDFNGDAIQTVIPTDTNTMLLPNSIVIGGVEYPLGGNSYSVAVKRRGTTEIFNSDFSTEFSFVRLNDVANVHTEGGVLCWTTADIEGYTPEYSLIYNGSTKQMSENSFDFEDYKSTSTQNELNVSIACIGNDKFMTSRRTSEYTLDILDTPINVTTDQANIVWDAVSGANAYKLEVTQVFITNTNGIENISYGETKYYTTTETSYALSSNVNASQDEIYNVRVMAITTESDNNKINSRYSDLLEVNKPAVITNITFNNTLKRWEWDEATGIKTYIFNYSYNDTTITTVEVTTPYFKPTQLGKYSLVSVQAKSEGAGGILSNKAQWEVDQDMGVYNFDLYTSGEGKVDNPYIISNMAELFNIKYYADKEFKIGNMINFNNYNDVYRTYNDIDISIKDYLVSEGHMDSTGRIINGVDNFVGTLNGDNNVLLGASLVGNGNTRGLFNNTNGAVFKNINIKGFTLAGGKPVATQNEMYAGILVGNATNTTFNNINIRLNTNDTYSNSQINISTTEAISNRMYVGGLAGIMSGCNVSNVNVVLKMNSSISSYSSYINFGAIAGQTSATIMNTVVSAIDDTSNVNALFVYGGIVGNMASGTITNAKSTVTMSADTKADIVGGIAGISTGEIANAVSYGTLRARGLVTIEVQRKGRIGGLIGRIDSDGTLSNSFTHANIYLDATTASSDHIAYAGRLVGETNGFITNCWVAVDNGTPIIEVNNPQGLTYGYAGVIVGYGDNFYIENCYQSVSESVAIDGKINYIDYNTMCSENFVNILNTNAKDTIFVSTATVPTFVWLAS